MDRGIHYICFREVQSPFDQNMYNLINSPTLNFYSIWFQILDTKFISLLLMTNSLTYSFPPSSFLPGVNGLRHKLKINIIIWIYLAAPNHWMIKLKTLFGQTLIFFFLSEVNYGEQLRNFRLSVQEGLMNRHSGNAPRFISVFEGKKKKTILPQILLLLLLTFTLLSLYSHTSWQRLLVGIYVQISE